jgi:hypothetical protein
VSSPCSAKSSGSYEGMPQECRPRRGDAGEWPEAGDLEHGHTLPAYRELARVLEPWSYRTPLA